MRIERCRLAAATAGRKRHLNAEDAGRKSLRRRGARKKSHEKEETFQLLARRVCGLGHSSVSEVNFWPVNVVEV